MAEELVSRTKVLNWMLKRLKPRDFDINKGAVGENLALLLQSSQANAQKAADLNGIDAILQVCTLSWDPSFQCLHIALYRQQRGR